VHRTVVGVTLRSDPSRRQDRGIADSDGADMDDLNDFVLDRLADDERRFEAGELPYIDEAERRGRLRIMRTDDHRGLLLVGGPVQATEDRVPVPFVEKAAFLRREIHHQHDDTMLGLVASVYDAHPDWREEWRP
jgi:hypothetical protein